MEVVRVPSTFAPGTVACAAESRPANFVTVHVPEEKVKRLII